MPDLRVLRQLLLQQVPDPEPPPRLAARSVGQDIPIWTKVLHVHTVPLKRRCELGRHDRRYVVLKDAVYRLTVGSPVREAVVVVESMTGRNCYHGLIFHLRRLHNALVIGRIISLRFGEPERRWLPTEEKPQSDTVDLVMSLQDRSRYAVEEIFRCRPFSSRADSLIHVYHDVILLEIKAHRGCHRERIFVVEEALATDRVHRGVHLTHQKRPLFWRHLSQGSRTHVHRRARRHQGKDRRAQLAPPKRSYSLQEVHSRHL